MKVLLAHNRYQHYGGEDAVFDAERALLADAGLTVTTHVVTNDHITGFGARLRSGLEAPYSRRARAAFAAQLRRDRPDVVHVHNLFPLLTPSILDACRDEGVPVVATLHNYRTLCASGLRVRNGVPCSLCVEGSPYWAVVHRCYRNSLPGSLAAANTVMLHRALRTWPRKVRLFITMSDFARAEFIAAGFPAEQLVVKPNFVPDPGPAAGDGAKAGVLYVGRLSFEKGIFVLLEAWKTAKTPLTIIGDGPEIEAVRAAQSPTVTFLGPKNAAEVLAAMRRHRFLVVPSIVFEGCPRVVAEAFGTGLPIIASRIGSLQELIQDGVNGLHAIAGDPASLAAVVDAAAADPARAAVLGRNARASYEQAFTPEQSLRALLAVYEAAVGPAGGRRP
ncbi:glycosyltransferase [Blastochloris sulfoviridis]|uniref:Glycosyltransferase family 4 protein n=1 Tax=Blastochloris sulfoviridis TaxID=50712 RepID=A0A5M6I5Z2_9HYPH|nr:glycosyltransferase [Blastochloris sulfoviridis]KAA5603671.1 glycosyltransferase family 4 protein [Blastochloris sulfoviridis]